ncbi:MAG: amidohydrolase family protein [Chloroflexota bacterium]|nr:amidohydrolase family protein [Dehalococcoidia bacterium]MDW8255279.1 amidohydrolase family protein [Chloroflexota bacterium]
MPEHVDLLVRGGLTITVDPERRVFRRGYLAVKDGRIVGVGRDADCPFTADETIDASERILLPGFVSAHCHLIGGYVRGVGADRVVQVGSSAAMMISARLRQAMDGAACYAGARLAILELQKSGVTTFADSQPALAGKEEMLDGTLHAITESGARCLFTRASQNRTDFLDPRYHDSIDRAIPELERLTDRWASDRIEIAAEAQALHRVEEDLLKALARWSRERGVHFAMHLSYSREAAAHAVERFGRPLMLLLDEWGVLDQRFLGFHPVWLSEEEIAVIAQRDAGVAYCPVDNMLIASGVAPVRALLEAGVRLGLGLDQPNDSHNFFELMKVSLLLQRVHSLDPTFGSPELAIELGTLGGARALHREAEIGSLEVGKAADFILLDIRRPPLNPPPGRLSNIVLAASPAEVESVYVGGEAIIRAGRHLRWDEDEVVLEANRMMAQVAARAELGEEIVPFTRWPVL